MTPAASRPAARASGSARSSSAAATQLGQRHLASARAPRGVAEPGQRRRPARRSSSPWSVRRPGRARGPRRRSALEGGQLRPGVGLGGGADRRLPLPGAARRTRRRGGRGCAGPSSCSSSCSAAYSRRLISIVNRASPSRSSPARRTRLLSSSDSTTSRRSGSAHTAAALSRSHSPGKTESRRKAARSRSDSRSWLQAMAARRSRCRSGASRGPLVSSAHPAAEPERELARREHPQPRGGQLDRQRQPVETDADLGQRAGGVRREPDARAARGPAAARRPGCRAGGRGRRRRRPRAWAGAVRRTRARPPAGAAPGWWRAPAAGRCRAQQPRRRPGRAGSESSRCSQLSRTTSRPVGVVVGVRSRRPGQLGPRLPRVADGCEVHPAHVVVGPRRPRARAGSCRRPAAR